MQINKPSPGPWRVVYCNQGIIVRSGQAEYDICEVCDWAAPGNPETVANARLIAAAPALLAALRRLVNCQTLDREYTEACEEAYAAITQATQPQED